MFQHLGMRLTKDQLIPVLPSREHQASMLCSSLAQEAKGGRRLMHFQGQRTPDQVLSVQMIFPGTTGTWALGTSSKLFKYS